MKYFEFKEPYYALIRADDKEEAVKLYISYVADIYVGEVYLIKEVNEDEAFGKYASKYNETDSINEMTLSFHNHDLLLVDGCLL